MLSRFRKEMNIFVSKVSKKEITTENTATSLEDLELILLQNDVALQTTQDLLSNLSNNIKNKQVSRLDNLGGIIQTHFKNTLFDLFDSTQQINLINQISQSKKIGKPFKILFIGVNGTGKSTSVAKLANLLKKQGYSIVLACADTFRAGAIEQLEIHASRLGVKIIKQNYGSDSAAVAYDAVQHALAKNLDVVIIDTAGRQYTDVNLLNELKKVKTVIEPDITLLVVDALTGNDALSQAKTFESHIKFNGVIITKMDADAKGGAILSIVNETKNPVLYMGVGQNYEDIKTFNSRDFVNSIF